MQTRGSCFFTALTLAAAVCLSAAPIAAQTNPPVISEFMAANNSVLADEDGSYPDWIEIYNPSPNPVNLLGWSLTDRANNLTKWSFPATNLAPFSYLVVFASGKDRTTPGAPLHTSFSLDAGGEYLALVDNQQQVIYAYAPEFPDQLDNQSYGPGMVPNPSATLVPVGATARFLVPAAEMGTAWTGKEFDDAAWSTGPTALGFDGGTNYIGIIATNLSARMLGVNASLYTRLPFTVDDPAALNELKLQLRYDDGFIAYLNGTEVARANAPANAAWNAAALNLHGSESGAAGSTVANFDGATSPYTVFTNASSGYTPSPPTLQAADAGSTGQFFRLITDGTAYSGNSLAFDRSAAGTYPLITADFDFRITDANNDPADGFAFLLIPTSTYGNSGPGAFKTYAGVEEPNFTGVFAVGFDMYPHATANDVSVHWNGQELQNVTIPLATNNLVSGTFNRCSIKLEFASDGSGAFATVAITPNINGTPGARFVALDRFFIGGLRSYECRAEFAGRTGGSHMSVDLDNFALNLGYPGGLVAPENFDLSRFLGLLQPGTNVLAIHGLNVAASSPDFLLEPLLMARSLTLQRGRHIYFTAPTPGALNSGGEAEIAGDAQYSVPGGIYTSNVTVALSSPLPGAVIHYTINGSQVTELSPQYTNPIALAGSAIISSRVFAPGYFPSPQRSQYYTLVEPAAAAFSSKLPVVIIDTLGQRLLRDMEPRATGIFTVIDTAPVTGRAALLGQPDYHGRAGMEGRGQSSWDSFPKKPYNVEIRGEDDLDKQVEILGFPAGADFALVNPYTDKTFLNDFLGYEMYEKMGYYTVRRRHVEVFYNGQMEGQGTDSSPKVGLNDRIGIYLLVEKIRVDNDRVDIQKPQSGAPGDPITGGFIWKKDKDSPGDVNFTTTSGQFLKYHDPRGDQLTKTQRDWLLAYLNEFESVLYGPNWRDPATGYASYIDVDSWVDQHWIVEFTKQIDGYRLSNYMQKDRGGKIKMSPIWDWNLSLGNANYLEGGRTNGWYWPLISSTEHIWLRQLVGAPGDPDFQQQIVDRWPALIQPEGPFNLSNLLVRIDQLTNLVSEAAAYDFTRWPRLGTYVWPNPNGSAGGWNVDYQNPTTYSAIIGQMKIWLTGRYNWIDGQFVKPPSLSRRSGPAAAPLTMLAPAAAIYYTLDGSDPRVTGGAVSPRALLYAGDIIPAENSRIMARAWRSNQWSAPVTAEFGALTPALAVSEIMYHPAPGAGFDAEEFEFLELVNTSAATIDLGGARVVDGVNFSFPLGPLQPTGAATTNGFDAAGTPFTPAKLGSDPGAGVVAGGPADSFLRLVSQNSGTNRNRAAFDQTAAGPYDQVVAEFDFRGQNLSVTQAVGAPTLQNFDDSATNYVLNSFDTTSPDTPAIMPPEAGSSGQFVRLTKQVGSDNGGIYFNTTADRAYSIVVANFDFRCNGAADGFGFAFLNTANHGTSGVGPAFSEEVNLAGSIGLGFDIYLNTQSATEPNANHVSLHFNNAQVGVASPSLGLAANKFHRAQLTIQFQGGQALVTLKISPDVNGSGGPTETLFSNFVINGVTPYRGRVAFCGRTGGSFASQDIDNVNVQYLDSMPVAPGGLSLVMLPTAAFGSTGAGSTLAHYGDVPAGSNLFGLNLDMHVESSINAANIYWNGVQVGSTTIPSPALDLDGGVFHRARLELNRAAAGSLATLTLTPDALGAAGPPLLIFSNLLVTGLFPGDARIELAGRSGGQNLNVDVDNLSVRCATNEVVPLAPGERVLLVKNLAAFTSRYGTNRPVAGVYAGLLDNAGERLAIIGRYGEPLLDFTYRDGWQNLSDGYGFSLVSVNPALAGQSEGWRLSAAVGGSPGQADPAPPAIVPVVVNEVLSRPVPPLQDAVELHNPTTNTADLSSWWLSDDFQQPFKYRFPAGTSIQPGGFLVVTEADFNQLGDPAAFALRGEGEAIYLFSANASGELTGYYHGFDFGAALDNVSFGRYVTSDGNDHLPAQVAMTFGTNNAGPVVGPVVISEVMYHPPDDPGGVENQKFEYVELHNITDQPVWLFDPAYPAHTWRLRDAVDFTFPTGVVLPPHGRVLVLSFNPATDTAWLAEFRARYGLATDQNLYGPYGGKLDNSSDRVELVMPGRPDATTGNADEILVDKVRYSDNPPWPLAADGAGYSLQRVSLFEFGNDPQNWVAGPPTAGRDNVAAAPPSIVVQPADVTVLTFGNASMTVTATGDGPLSYQWYFNGNLLAGATNAILALNSVGLNQAGVYQAVALSPGGAAASRPATLTVYEAAQFLTQPKGGAVPVGGSTNLVALATGNGPVVYQWRLNGEDLPNATNATLALTNLQLSQSGAYSVVATDALGGVASQPAQLTVATVPVVTQPPIGRLVAVGQNLTLSAAISGSEPIAYKWQRGGTDISAYSPTNQTFVIPNAQLSDGNAYRMAATNAARLTNPVYSVLVAMVVVQPPADRTTYVGGTVTLSVAASLAANARFQWQFAGTNLAGKTAAALTLANVQTNQAGTYTCLVSNTANAAAWAAFSCQLTVLDQPQAPAIVAQPASVFTNLGANAAFSIAVTGTELLTYQWWFKQTNLVTGATNATLLVTNVSLARLGDYRIVVSNSVGTATSEVALLDAPLPPAITASPVSTQTLAGAAVQLAVEATGTPPLSYQWWQLGPGLLPQATNAGLALDPVALADAGDYYAIVSSPYGKATSAVARVTVLSPPALLVQPVNQQLTNGQTARFYVVAAGTAPLAYQWYRSPASPLPGETASALVISNAQPDSAAGYYVTVVNAAGSADSATAFLSFSQPSADSDNDGMPDDWERQYGLTVGVNDAAADQDRDGLTNLEEYLAGTAPNDPASVLKFEAAAVAGVGGGAVFAFTAVSNKTYSVQYQDALGGTNWLKLYDVPALPATRPVLVTNSGAGLRFFRLTTPQVP